MAELKDKLYYDGSCPLCSAEMLRLDNLSHSSLDLIDIHQLDLMPDARDKLLKVLHLETRSGETLTGLDANVAAWQHTDWGFLFRWLRWPGIRRFADKIYLLWASRRFEKMYHR